MLSIAPPSPPCAHVRVDESVGGCPLQHCRKGRAPGLACLDLFPKASFWMLHAYLFLLLPLAALGLASADLSSATWQSTFCFLGMLSLLLECAWSSPFRACVSSSAKHGTAVDVSFWADAMMYSPRKVFSSVTPRFRAVNLQRSRSLSEG